VNLKKMMMLWLLWMMVKVKVVLNQHEIENVVPGITLFPFILTSSSVVSFD
jgi:hypothetical protein